MEVFKVSPLYPKDEQKQKIFDYYLTLPCPPIEIVIPVQFTEKVEKWRYRLHKIEDKFYYFPAD